MKTLATAFTIAALSLLSHAAFAVGTQTGQVTQVIVRASDGLNYVYINGAPTGRAPCGAGQVYWIIKDENSNSGKKQLALLLAAKTSGQVVNITGTGACSRWPDGEDIDSLSIIGN